MGWQDRQYRPPREDGGFRRALGRLFDSGGFLGLAVPLFTIAGIRVRIHIFFIIYIAIELIYSVERGTLGLPYTALSMFTLFTLVLLHEFGHCIACRKVGGEASDILMWPLGGLASCNPPHNPRAALITTIGGPLVNLLLAPVLGLLLLATGVSARVLVFNPISPSIPLSEFAAPTNALYYLRVALFSAYMMNFYLFCFNVFLPMFPMDGGRILQELLWFRKGHRRSMQIAVNVGFIAAICVGIFALTLGRGNNTLLYIAIFCGFICWKERMQLAVLEPEAFPGYDFERGYQGMPGARRGRAGSGAAGGTATRVRTGPTKSDLKRQKEEQDLNAEVDRILEKIRTEGMASLTKKEKATLQGETERKRRQSTGN